MVFSLQGDPRESIPLRASAGGCVLSYAHSRMIACLCWCQCLSAPYTKIVKRLIATHVNGDERDLNVVDVCCVFVWFFRVRRSNVGLDVALV